MNYMNYGKVFLMVTNGYNALATYYNRTGHWYVSPMLDKAWGVDVSLPMDDNEEISAFCKRIAELEEQGDLNVPSEEYLAEDYVPAYDYCDAEDIEEMEMHTKMHFCTFF